MGKIFFWPKHYLRDTPRGSIIPYIVFGGENGAFLAIPGSFSDCPPAADRIKEQVMGTGILICGLNGAGKSTLGKVLAEKLGFHFIDNEDLYFPKTDPAYVYTAPRTRDEVEALLLQEIKIHEDFVFASVKGDYGENVCARFDYAVLLTVPRELRLRRVRERSFQKFGSRMLPGGDLHEQEEGFFALAASRAEDTVEEWVQDLSCPVIRVDGTRPAAENTDFILAHINMTK